MTGGPSARVMTRRCHSESSTEFETVSFTVCVILGGIIVVFVAGFLLRALWRRRLQKRAIKAIETAMCEHCRLSLQEKLHDGASARLSFDQLRKARARLRVLERKHTDYESILEAIENGDTRLVRGSWLASECSRLRRCQELPAEAFWSPADLHAMIKHLQIIAISYCWLHSVHPDPRGEHLAILHRTISLRMAEKGEARIDDLAIFLDYLSLPQDAESGDEANPVPGEVRSPDDMLVFQRGLGNVNLWYSHQDVVVWLLRWVPERIEHAYADRGWPFFEWVVASMIKDAMKLIDVGVRTFECAEWDVLMDAGRMGRNPPMVPDKFAALLEGKHFTNGTEDKDFVRELYRRTFKEVLDQARTLWFDELGWGDDEAEELALALPYCNQLEQLLLDGNLITDRGAAAVIRAARACPILQGLDLRRNPIGATAQFGFKQQWFSAGKPQRGLKFTWCSEASVQYEPLGMDLNSGPGGSGVGCRWRSVTSLLRGQPAPSVFGSRWGSVAGLLRTTAASDDPREGPAKPDLELPTQPSVENLVFTLPGATVDADVP